jgi:hypothetical protein
MIAVDTNLWSLSGAEGAQSAGPLNPAGTIHIDEVRKMIPQWISKFGS